jgi:predicted ester cyclase
MQIPVTEEQAKTIGEWYARSRNEADLSLLDKIFCHDVIVHDPSRPDGISGLCALKDQYRATHAAVPDVKFTLDDLYIKGDRIAWIFTMSGTITGTFRTPLGEIPPTGKFFNLSGVAVDRIAEGKIAEEWVYYNVLDILQPLGFTLAPPMPHPAEAE